MNYQRWSFPCSSARLFTGMALSIFLLISVPLGAEDDTSRTTTPVSLEMFGDGIHHWKLEHEIDYPRYDPSEFVKIADNLLQYQNEDGGWPKNIDWLGKLDADSLLSSYTERYRRSTFDNRNTYPQIEYLAKVYTRTGFDRFKDATRRGIEYVLGRQHANGGWRGWDVDAITFNDDVMTGIMNLLLDISLEKSFYSWLDDSTRSNVDTALEQAIDVTLECQIEVNGMKTVWCQQHDHETYEPVKGRSYELPSKTAWESTSVVEFLMRLPEPSQRVIHSVEAAIAWFEKSRIRGIKVKEVTRIMDGEEQRDRIVMEDASAPPIWARYYEVETNRPFFCRRSGEKVYSLQEVNHERRIGYDWYGYWPQELLEKQYPAWREKHDLPD
ncbi:MAG: pectate lyase [Candidatus Marinimicrobia bacterium]|nr:pectate lyase [Candidatus Neomarinimicrobiota bacterium]MCF7828317.1 pectate lyase [Candidatus Neomarinimicrobiota bacterium]MCF7879508.1 pectate lyase [Candidatus Neomarinimicrobiota bacterium]